MVSTVSVKTPFETLFTVGAVTTSCGWLFHMLTTLLLKNEFCYFSLPVSNYDLASSDWMLHAVEVDLSNHLCKFRVKYL